MNGLQYHHQMCVYMHVSRCLSFRSRCSPILISHSSKAHAAEPNAPATSSSTIPESSPSFAQAQNEAQTAFQSNPNPSLSQLETVQNVPPQTQAIIQSKPKKPPKTHNCPYPSCLNRYKQLSGLRYHYFHVRDAFFPVPFGAALIYCFAQKTDT